MWTFCHDARNPNGWLMKMRGMIKVHVATAAADISQFFDVEAALESERKVGRERVGNWRLSKTERGKKSFLSALFRKFSALIGTRIKSFWLRSVMEHSIASQCRPTPLFPPPIDKLRLTAVEVKPHASSPVLFLRTFGCVPPPATAEFWLARARHGAVTRLESPFYSLSAFY